MEAYSVKRSYGTLSLVCIVIRIFDLLHQFPNSRGCADDSLTSMLLRQGDPSLTYVLSTMQTTVSMKFKLTLAKEEKLQVQGPVSKCPPATA